MKTNGSLVRFGYDAVGRRVRRSTASQTLWYIYAGNQVAAEIDSATTTVQRKYRYYPGTVDAPHSVVTGGKTYYYLADAAVGSVLAVVDSTGTVANRYRYSPFGVLEDSVESIANPIRFAGREYDANAQLYYNRARYYDPQLGRFISEDPAGLGAGLNQYAYAGNDPVNKSDPSGLWPDNSGGSFCRAYTDGSCGRQGAGGGYITTLGFAGAALGAAWDTGNNDSVIQCFGSSGDCARAFNQIRDAGIFAPNAEIRYSSLSDGERAACPAVFEHNIFIEDGRLMFDHVHMNRISSRGYGDARYELLTAPIDRSGAWRWENGGIAVNCYRITVLNEGAARIYQMMYLMYDNWGQIVPVGRSH